MNYPLWLLHNFDGGMLIAVIAILHVFISHLAVGGGLFLVLTERLALVRRDHSLLRYVERHTWFFLLLTMVFGGVSGVGIWFVIALVQPAATSKLIHEFVFGWATEWVFFIIEIVALLLYHYLFRKLKPQAHQILGWIYAAAAWLSLAVIHGILSFMLTPGRWLQTHNFWDGFFNPGYFPGLVLRTAIALSFAGLFGLVTVLRIPDKAQRERLTRYCAAWVLWPMLALLASGYWYYSVTNTQLGGTLLQGFRFATPLVPAIFWVTALLFFGGLLLLLRLPRAAHFALITMLLMIGLGWIGVFEYLRQNARRPWIIYGYMYANSICVDDLPAINNDGFLKQAQWVQSGTAEEAGKSILTHQCMICHTLDGHRALRPRVAQLTEFGLLAQLTGQGTVQTYMPPFAGTAEEKALLAQYIADNIDSQQLVAPPAISGKLHVPAPPAPALSAGEPTSPQYVLLCWNDLGMHCMTDANNRWLLLPPANTLWAQLIERGNPPRVLTNNVSLKYQIEAAHAHPEQESDFWDYTKLLFDAELQPGVGLGGKGLSGEFDKNQDKGAFVAHLLPVIPYAGEKFNPYPQFTVSAYGPTGRQLAQTQVVAPVSTEMGCRNCHGGNWTHGVAGVAETTADNVLQAHDRLSGTDLLAQAIAGRPHKCQDCHADPALAAPGLPGVPNLSSAVHGFHANYMRHIGSEACNKCHPSDPQGATRCLRGVHSANVQCTDCHGTMSEHALGLLRLQQDLGIPAAPRLMRNLTSASSPDPAEIKPRMPWINEPDCLHCHQGFTLSRADSFNRWTAGFDALYRNRTDNHNVMCAACHGSPHAVYPANNMYSPVLDNYQSLQYQGVAGPIGKGSRCLVCHTAMPGANGHHTNMLRSPAQ